MQDKEDARLKADVDEIMQRVRQIMENVDSLDPGRGEDGQSDQETP
jgi:hypothetical protein